MDYYGEVGDIMLPHLTGRIISMHRWPNGLDGDDFSQKQVPDYFPDWIRTEDVKAALRIAEALLT